MNQDMEAVDIIARIPSAGQPTLVQRSNMAVQHLMAAARFSRLCGVVQSANAGKPLGDFYDEQTACVSATIMLAVASMESNINEHLEDSNVLLPELSPGARNEVCNLLSKATILDKYTRILVLKELPPFDKGRPTYQNAALLIAVRNELVHFHPEWHDSQDRHEKLGRALTGRFALSPFMTEDTAVMFPQRIISHGCTQWAVKSALALMEDFAKRVSLPSRFLNHGKHLSP